MREGRWDEAKKLLCVRLDTIGDVLMTTPAMRALRDSGKRITLLTSPAAREVASLIPEVDDAIVYDAPWMKATAPRRDFQPDARMIERLRAGKFDAAVIFTVYSQNPLPAAFVCYMAGIPLRLAHCHENPYQLLTDWVRDPEPAETIRHEAERQLALVRTIGCDAVDQRLSFRVPQKRLRAVRDLLASKGVDSGRPWIVVHPGASAPSRRYAPESFAAAASELVRRHRLQIVFTGESSEVGLVESIRTAMETTSFSLAGELDLASLGALLSMSPLLLSNNTGPVHVAAAVGTPVVDLYALTNPQHTPWQVPNRVLFHDVPCKFCYRSVCPELHHDCLRKVSPEQVVAATVELLRETSNVRLRGGP